MNPTGYSQVIDELVNGSVTRTYAYGLQGISENQLINGTWTPSFYGYDGHGNVRLLANSSGGITDTYQFEAFGNLINQTGTTPNNYLYSGERFDSALNLYHLRARYYNISPVDSRRWTRQRGTFSIQPRSTSTSTRLTIRQTYSIRVERTLLVEIRFSTHALDYLIEEGFEFAQPEVQAQVEAMVREYIIEAEMTPGQVVDVTFIMAQLNYVPWAARIFIVTEALVSVNYFPKL